MHLENVHALERDSLVSKRNIQIFSKKNCGSFFGDIIGLNFLF